MISGGCLERDLSRQAAALCEKGPRLISFDTRSESTNYTARYNLGCSGIIYILVEPVTGGQNCPLRNIREVVSARQPQVTGTVYHSERFQGVAVGDRVSPESQLGEAVLLSYKTSMSKSPNPVDRFAASSMAMPRTLILLPEFSWRSSRLRNRFGFSWGEKAIRN